jgi:glutathione S-transferase
VDVARLPVEQGGGAGAVVARMQASAPGVPPLAPPILEASDLVLSQVANICLFLGRRHGLCPADEAGVYHANQLQLTIADLVAEVHDTHHPIATGLYYQEQIPEACRRAAYFRRERLPRFLDYFEHVLTGNAAGGHSHLVGTALSYVDISMFQVLAGLAYAFPGAYAQASARTPLLVALKQRIANMPRIAAYLTSDRRIAFNSDGVFRYYPELNE